MATATKDVSLNKKVSQFFWRSWAIQASWNYERQMNMGFLYGMVPTLDRLYPDESDPKQLAAKKEAYHRHMAFYNCTLADERFHPGPLRLHGGRSTPRIPRTSILIRSTQSRPLSWVRFPASVTPSSRAPSALSPLVWAFSWLSRAPSWARSCHAHLHRPLCADHLVRSQDGLSGRPGVPEQASGRRPHGEAYVCLRHRGSYVRGRHDRHADRRHHPAAVR